jgi:colanic acid biosynthesis glycosyl transferase WcaI
MACHWMYRRVHHIILHSHGFREELLKRGVPPEKMTTVSGWTHEPAQSANRLTTPKSMKDTHGIKVLYAGNIGPAQALDSVLNAAHILQSEGQSQVATFYIIGSGLAREELMAKADSLALTNMVFLPQVPPSEIGDFLAAADVLLVHLRDTPLFSLNIPSKVQTYMLAAKPILIGVRGEAAHLIHNAKAGVCVSPENPREIANAVISLSSMSMDARKQLGENGRAFYWRTLCMAKGIVKFVDVFDRVRS